MAKRFLTALRLLNLSADPPSASNGDVYYNSSLNKAKIYQNGSWKNIPSDLEDLSDVSISATPSDGQVLTYVNSTSKWENKNVSSLTPAATTETGTSFPGSPSLAQFFFNTVTDKLYFFSNFWNEVSLNIFNVDGGFSSNNIIEAIFDGGSSSTTTFNAGIYDAGSASLLFEGELFSGSSYTTTFTSGQIDSGSSSTIFDGTSDGGSSYTMDSAAGGN